MVWQCQSLLLCFMFRLWTVNGIILGKMVTHWNYKIECSHTAPLCLQQLSRGRNFRVLWVSELPPTSYWHGVAYRRTAYHPFIRWTQENWKVKAARSNVALGGSRSAFQESFLIRCNIMSRYLQIINMTLTQDNEDTQDNGTILHVEQHNQLMYRQASDLPKYDDDRNLRIHQWQTLVRQRLMPHS